MLKELTDWLVSLAKKVFGALWDFCVDIAIAIFDLILGALVGLVSIIPVPSFMSEGLQSLWGQLDGGVMYFVSAAGLPQALAMLGAAYLFRIGRKVVTLFQW